MKKNKNYLDCIPIKNPKIFDKNDSGDKMALEFENTGVFNRVMQKVCHKPKTTTVHLDDFGTFIWLKINGEDSIYQIGQALKKEFGAKAEPLYPRLVQYFRQMEMGGFVDLK